jgi:hypothetical protein
MTSNSQAAERYQEPDFEAVLAKGPTALQEHFLDWVLEKTGYDPAAAKTKAVAFAEGVRISAALRGAHQASPENQQRLAASRAAASTKAAEETAPVPVKVAKKTAPAATTTAGTRPAKKAAPKKTAPPAEVAPTVKRAAAKRAPARKGTPAAATAPAEDEAPF